MSNDSVSFQEESNCPTLLSNQVSGTTSASSGLLIPVRRNLEDPFTRPVRPPPQPMQKNRSAPQPTISEDQGPMVEEDKTVLKRMPQQVEVTVKQEFLPESLPQIETQSMFDQVPRKEESKTQPVANQDGLSFNMEDLNQQPDLFPDDEDLLGISKDKLSTELNEQDP